jgi:predicted TIM-barrel fold metal-dependent hydrolase
MFDAWRRELRELARRPNVALKVGGLGMPVYHPPFGPATRPHGWEAAQAWRPYVETAIELFGPDRCMFESNFPIDKQTASYDAVWNAFKILTADYSHTERAQLFADTARRVYALPRLRRLQ